MEKVKFNDIVSVTGMLKNLKRKPCKQKIRKAKITNRIKQIHEESREIYGASKIIRIL